MTGSPITENELLDALAEAASGVGAENARTAQELSDETGMHVNAVRKALNRMQAQSRLQVHHVLRPALGRMARVPAYTILPAP